MEKVYTDRINMIEKKYEGKLENQLKQSIGQFNSQILQLNSRVVKAEKNIYTLDEISGIISDTFYAFTCGMHLKITENKQKMDDARKKIVNM